MVSFVVLYISRRQEISSLNVVGRYIHLDKGARSSVACRYHTESVKRKRRIESREQAVQSTQGKIPEPAHRGYQSQCAKFTTT